jgi:hypothetical protein
VLDAARATANIAAAACSLDCMVIQPSPRENFYAARARKRCAYSIIAADY